MSAPPPATPAPAPGRLSAASAPARGSVPAAFRRRAAAAPGNVALADGRHQYTYGELQHRADTLARALIAAGVAPGDRVVVCLERSAALVTTLLAVLAAGAVCLPVDPGEAPARLDTVLDDAGAAVAVCDATGRALLAGRALRHVDPDASAPPGPPAPLPEPGPEDVALLMYTSGSTGRPKGVMVPHRAVVNLATDPNYAELGPADRVLHLAPVAFDASTFEIWGALLAGARLEVAPPGPLAPAALGTVLRQRGITVLWLTAALFHRQVDEAPESLTGLRTLLAGGDVLSPAHVRALRAAAPGLALVNGYGPTEATTFSLCHRVGPDEEFPRSVPVGRPVQNTAVRLCDERGAPVPDGTPGELWIGGAGVALGYWRDAARTAERFVPDARGALWYRSGDLAVRRPDDGVVEFLGRTDGQVKLHGHRVEPGEVEHALTGHPAVRRAAVALRVNHLGDPRLVAWLVPAGAWERRALRAHLRERLPAHMVPAVFLPVDELPVTTNGKVDRQALPDPDWRRKENYV
ncbi:amino acid adenylation domain-containing protein [Streptomyces sp. NPDC090306]|uniref:amino acid adenylation domain-containing protein n=1 Tax=Streptomyces sp. NPDC090306 TaxID=3365961 RepID=UPI00380FC50A